MKKEQVIRSPLFYTGDKYKLIKELKQYFPNVIKNFYEPFVGGGSVFLNIEAEKYFANDINKYVIQLHTYLSSFKNPNDLFEILFSKIEKYNFSCSYKQDVISKELRTKYIKTYFAKYNAESYKQLKNDYNNSDRTDIAALYLLLIYGFNRMIRFNSNNKFNLPVGNVDFNKNVYKSLVDYINSVNFKNIKWFNTDYLDFLYKQKITEYDFVYVDPPYLIASSEYNKLWNQQDDDKLLQLLDSFSLQNIRFAMSNVTTYKGKENTKLLKWAEKYNLYPIKSNYINYHDNTVKSFTEVLITNYG
jgi:DNA adenine methylase